MAREPSSRADVLLPWLASASLFVGVTLLSQWIQKVNGKRSDATSRDRCDSCRRPLLPVSPPPLARQDDNECSRSFHHADDSTNPSVPGVAAAQRRYKQRRLHDRLSFHEHEPDPFDGATTMSNPILNGTADPDQSWRQSQQQPMLQSPSNDSQIEQTEEEKDIFPKNSNWNHFELRGDHRQALLGTISSHYEPDGESLEGDEGPSTMEDSESDDDAEEQFVWSTSIRSHHISRSPSRYNRPSASQPDSTDESVAPCNTNSRQVPQESSSSSLLSSMHLSRAISLDDRTLWDDHRLSKLSASTFNHYAQSLPNLVCRQNWAARAHYNSRIMPDRVILIRHGQSMGNSDEALYSTMPDNAMPLTRLGWEQANEAGRLLRFQLLEKQQQQSASTNGGAAISFPPVHFIVSPYVRTVETFHGIASAWCDPALFRHIPGRDDRLKAWYSRLLELGLTWHEDPRIREQDFGNYQVPEQIRQAKLERIRFGAFYYRFPLGESASDVYDRISTFLDSLWRSFDVNTSRNYCIITHGISIRVLLARYFRYTIDQFNLLANPRNASMVVLQHDGRGRLQLNGRYELEIQPDEYAAAAPAIDDKEGADDHRNNDCDPPESHVKGYKYHKRLKVLPAEHIHRVKIRMAFDD